MLLRHVSLGCVCSPQILTVPALLTSSPLTLHSWLRVKQVSEGEQGICGPPTSPHIALPVLPVREHAVVTPLRIHGFCDVSGYKLGFFHGINEVSRGLKYSVVSHEVSGPNISVISDDVNSRTIGSMSPEKEQGVSMAQVP